MFLIYRRKIPFQKNRRLARTLFFAGLFCRCFLCRSLCICHLAYGSASLFLQRKVASQNSKRLGRTLFFARFYPVSVALPRCLCVSYDTTFLISTVPCAASLLLRLPRCSATASRFLAPCRPFLCATAKCALQRTCKGMRPLIDMPEAWETLDLRADVIGRRTMKSGRQSIMSRHPLFFLARSVVLQVMGAVVAL